jgi:predicted transcriptional regulator
MKKNPGQVSAYLDANVLSMLEKIAADEDRSVSWLVGFAVKQLIADRVEKQQPFRDGAAKHRQVDLEDAIVAAVKRGPIKASKHK